MGLLSALYRIGLIVWEKRHSGFREPHVLPVRVISIGNITLGGTGKTPAVISVAGEALGRGLHPCVLTRGYKGRAKGPCIVKGGKPEKHGEQPGEIGIAACYGADAGDEPVLMAERLRDVPVIKCGDRYQGGLFALDGSLIPQQPSSVFIMDDGYQHRFLHRDVNILLIDATDRLMDAKLFPEGRLREPLGAIKRADVIVLTRSDRKSTGEITSLKDWLRTYNTIAPVYTSFYSPVSLVSASGRESGLSSLEGQRVYAFAGIANPNAFREQLAALGADVVRFRSFRDHHIYKAGDIDTIQSESAGLDILTTEKDLAKLKELNMPERLAALRIDLRISDDFYDHIFGGKK